MDKEVLTKFEIKEELEKVPITIIIKEEGFDIKEEVEKIPITIIVKEEVKELAKLKIVLKESNLSNIPKLVQEYSVKYSNYIYYL